MFPGALFGFLLVRVGCAFAPPSSPALLRTRVPTGRHMPQPGGSQRRNRAVVAVDPNLYIPEGVHLHTYLGFLGGTFGVIGTLLTYEKGRFKMKQRILCPYCDGGGVLTCAACVGAGMLLDDGAGGDSCQVAGVPTL